MKIPFFNSKKTERKTFEYLTQLLLLNDLNKLKKERENGTNFLLTDSYDGINILEYYIKYLENFTFDKREIVKFLIECNLDINHKGNTRTNESSSLHLAAYALDFELIKILIELGAEIDIQNKYGNTPLAEVVFNYRGESEIKKIISFLIEKGASLEKKNFHDVNTREHILNVGGGIDAGFNKKEWDLRDLL